MKYIIKEIKSYSVLGRCGLNYTVVSFDTGEISAAFVNKEDAEKYLKEKNNE